MAVMRMAQNTAHGRRGATALLTGDYLRCPMQKRTCFRAQDMLACNKVQRLGKCAGEKERIKVCVVVGQNYHRTLFAADIRVKTK